MLCSCSLLLYLGWFSHSQKVSCSPNKLKVIIFPSVSWWRIRKLTGFATAFCRSADVKFTLRISWTSGVSDHDCIPSNSLLFIAAVCYSEIIVETVECHHWPIIQQGSVINTDKPLSLCFSSKIKSWNLQLKWAFAKCHNSNLFRILYVSSAWPLVTITLFSTTVSLCLEQFRNQLSLNYTNIWHLILFLKSVDIIRELNHRVYVSLRVTVWDNIYHFRSPSSLSLTGN